MRLSVSTHDSGGGAAFLGLVTRLRAIGGQRQGRSSYDDEGVAVATMRLERKLARWTR